MSNESDLRRAVQSAYEPGPDFPHPALLARISADIKNGIKPRGQLSWIAGAMSAALAIVIVFAFIGFQRIANPAPHQPGASLASSTPSAVRSPSSPLAISGAAIPDGEVAVTYGPVTLSASGGVPPYKWSISGGTLPSGLTLDPNGTISGTPTSAGTADFTVRVADSAHATTDAPESMKIAPALTAGYLPACAGGNCQVEVGCTPCLVPASFGYVNGGSPPYSYRVTAGTLPPGTILNGLILEGPFNGSGGTFSFEVTVTDALGGKATLRPTFRVAPRLLLPSTGTCTGDYNSGCSVRLPYTGGVGTPSAGASVYTCSYGCTAGLPPGVSVVVSGGAVTVTFPKGMVKGWKGILYVQVADAYTTTAMFPTQVSVEVRPQGG